MPYQFLQGILDEVPTVPRPLKRVDGDKKKKYLELAAILMKRFPSDVGGRAVRFLLDLVQNTDPGALPPIPFVATPGPRDLIEVTPREIVQRIVPTVRFEAVIARHAFRQQDQR